MQLKYIQRARCCGAVALLLCGLLLLAGCSDAMLTEEGNNLVNNAILGIGEVPFGNQTEQSGSGDGPVAPPEELFIKIVSQSRTVEGGFAYLEYPIVFGMQNGETQFQLNEMMKAGTAQKLEETFEPLAAQAVEQGQMVAMRQYATVTYQQGNLFNVVTNLTVERDGVKLSQDITSQIFNRISGEPLTKKQLIDLSEEGKAAFNEYITFALDQITELFGVHTFSGIERQGVLILQPGDIQIAFAAGEIADKTLGEFRFSVYNEQTKPYVLVEGFVSPQAPAATEDVPVAPTQPVTEE